MLFICLCGVFNMLLDKLCANPLINTIDEYFLKTVVSQKVTDPDWLRLTQKHSLKQGLGTETRYQYGTGTYVTGMY